MSYYSFIHIDESPPPVLIFDNLRAYFIPHSIHEVRITLVFLHFLNGVGVCEVVKNRDKYNDGDFADFSEENNSYDDFFL